MSSFNHAVYDTYNTMDVFGRQNPFSLWIEKPIPKIPAEDLLKKKYKVDAIPEEDFDRLMAEVQKIQAKEGPTTRHPLQVLRKMWEEETEDKGDAKDDGAKDDGAKDDGAKDDGAKDQKKGWFSFFSLW